MSMQQVCPIVPNAVSGIYYPNMVLGLHCDGSNGGTGFPDDSYNNATATVITNAQTATSDYKFGTASGRFTGPADNGANSYNGRTGRPHILFPDIADYDLSDRTKDATLHFWYKAGDTSAKRQIIMGNGHPFHFSGYGGGWTIQQSTTGTIQFYLISSTGSSILSKNSTATVSTSAWIHVAVVLRWTGSTRQCDLYMDGVKQSSTVSSTAFAGSPTADLRIGVALKQGNLDYLSYPGNFYIDDIVLQNGTAQWPSSNFTPPSLPFA